MKIYKRRFDEDRRNLLPKTFQDWLDVQFKGDFKKFMYEYDAHEEDLPYDSLDEYFDEQSELYLDWIFKYKKFKFPLTLYRIISLKAKNINDIRNIKVKKVFQKGVGIYWTDGKGQLEAYWSEGGKNFTLKADIQEENIDWNGMLLANMHPILGESESEIRLETGTKIKLTGIAEGKTVNKEDFIDLDFYVKA